MKNFKERALAWADAHPAQQIEYSLCGGYRSLTPSGFSFASVEHAYQVNGRPLTEVIEEWENKMNKMPELKPGMIIEAETGRLFMYVDRHAYTAGAKFTGYGFYCNPVTGVVSGHGCITKVFASNTYGLHCKDQYKLLELLWERKSEEEEKLEGIISDLEQNLEDARERLEALK